MNFSREAEVPESQNDVSTKIGLLECELSLALAMVGTTVGCLSIQLLLVAFGMFDRLAAGTLFIALIFLLAVQLLRARKLLAPYGPASAHQ